VISLSSCVRAVAPPCVLEILFWYLLFLLPKDGVRDKGVPTVFGSGKELGRRKVLDMMKKPQ
jgi:hypothetical protein